MVRWIQSFSDEVRRETGRRPVIYTTTNWWTACTGASRAFAVDHALWISRHGSADPGRLPGRLAVLDHLAARHQGPSAG